MGLRRVEDMLSKTGTASREAVWFTSPDTAEIIPEDLGVEGFSSLKDHGLKIRTIFSGISAGTEMLVYHGKAPKNLPIETGEKNGSSANLDFPVKYGYCNVGRVLESKSEKFRPGDVVFSFHPHETEFVTNETSCVLIPPGVDPKLGVFIANIETAIGIVHDSKPLLGECAAVFGLGVVGLLVSYLLKKKAGVQKLIAIDPIEERRKLASKFGANKAIHPGEAMGELDLPAIDGRPDLVVEVSGSPSALQQAISISGKESRIVVGSWYGDKEVSLNMGRTFHRNRNKIISSQVSSIGPDLSGRWDKRRRLEYAVSLLSEIPLEDLISDVFPFERAADAYRKISERPRDTLQVVLDYSQNSR